MKCLNCDRDVKESYCSNCGQKASTHRFSLKHLFDLEFLSGAFMINKGLLFTLKTLFTRPGHGIREFIQGKRVYYFNAFSLVLLLLAIMFFLDEYSDLKLSDVMGEESKDFTTSFEEIMTEYPRLVYLINIPIMAISSFMFFRKSKFNLAEHIILNTYNTSASIILSMPFAVLTIFYNDTEVLGTMLQFSTLLSFAYSVWLYYQFFSGSGYKKSSLIWRSLFAIVVYALLQGTTFAIIVGIKKLI